MSFFTVNWMSQCGKDSPVQGRFCTVPYNIQLLVHVAGGGPCVPVTHRFPKLQTSQLLLDSPGANMILHEVGYLLQSSFE